MKEILVLCLAFFAVFCYHVLVESEQNMIADVWPTDNRVKSGPFLIIDRESAES